MPGWVSIPSEILVEGGAAASMTLAHKGLLLELYARAAWATQEIPFHDGTTLRVERGEVLSSQRTLADALGATRKQVRCGLEALLRSGLIETVNRARGGAQGKGPGKGPEMLLVRLRYLADNGSAAQVEGPSEGPRVRALHVTTTRPSPTEKVSASDTLPGLSLPDSAAPTEEARRPRRAPPPAAEGTSRWVLETFCETWRRRRQSDYPPSWSRDLALAKRLLGFQGATPGEVTARIGRFFDRQATDAWLSANASFPLFVNRWASLDGRAVSLQSAGGGRRREFMGLDGDGKPVYREA